MGMIEKRARRKVSELLRKVALGRVTSDEFENALLDMLSASKDGVIYAVYRTVSEMADETDQSLAHLFERGGEMRNRLCRWILFLKTDLKYEWPKERLAPGLRDFYRPNWLDQLSGVNLSTNSAFCGRGDYHVWPFIREADFHAAKKACAKRGAAGN
jgi:hypothetical protein